MATHVSWRAVTVVTWWWSAAVLSWAGAGAEYQPAGAVAGAGAGASKMFSNFKPQLQRLSKEQIFRNTNVVSNEYQVSTTASAINSSSYLYLQESRGPLTLIIRPCSGSINVTISHVPQASTNGYLSDYLNNVKKTIMRQSQGARPHVISWDEAPAGLYVVALCAEHRAVNVTLYATRMSAVPPIMRIRQQPRVRITPRLRRNRLTVRWQQSVVDPHMMHYYLVVNSKRNFSSLCEAQSVQAQQLQRAAGVTLDNRIHRQAGQQPTTVLGSEEVFIIPVGPSTSYTISDLQKGRIYFFNVFVKNHQTKLSFLYASKAYNPKIKPVGLKDNKPITVNIRRLGGRALFRYKVSKAAVVNGVGALSWSVLPCGAPVLAEVRLRRETVLAPRMVEGYAHLTVPNPKPDQRYILHVTVTSPEHMRHIMGVEVLATMNSSQLPDLPAEATVYEYPSLRTCESVTVGWVPVAAPGQIVRYCVSAAPVSWSWSQFSSHPNQCNLNTRLSSQFDFIVKHCQDFSANDNRNVLVETITKLRRGKEYLIQVTVKKIKGKALSYDLLRVRTNDLNCDS